MYIGVLVHFDIQELKLYKIHKILAKADTLMIIVSA